MPKRRSSVKTLPVKYRSVPDDGSNPPRYNEPALPSSNDKVPSVAFQLADSKADLRLRIEKLLLRKETTGADEWARLGPQGRDLLVDLLEDEAIRAHDALFHRLISVIGQLSVKRSIAPLSAILNDRSETNLTKTYAANALGRIGESAAISALVQSSGTKDDMVRRQVAIALGRIDRDSVIPHLRKLQHDPSMAVAEVAAEAIRRWEEKVGQSLGEKIRIPSENRRRKKILPKAD